MAKGRKRRVLANHLGVFATLVHERVDAALTRTSGLGPSDNQALVILGSAPGMTVRGLERQLGLSQSATVRLVDRLQAAGHVVRRQGRDKRELALFLSALGEDCCERLLTARQNVLAMLTANFDKDERRLLQDMIDRLFPLLDNDDMDVDQRCRTWDRDEHRRQDELLGHREKEDATP
ncbi:MAG: MarR family transcriptional regulator [Pseudomonadota bacterium]